ncbi:hypothetical protein [Laspinema palackyanum]|uniref:hypothetical protein n=1 Tax=Laspinema palackyanum TaxID=3231601 RepID=UPI00345C6280|nr:hypothetical protein [Laspinema sp. D2c]
MTFIFPLLEENIAPEMTTKIIEAFKAEKKHYTNCLLVLQWAVTYISRNREAIAFPTPTSETPSIASPQFFRENL